MRATAVARALYGAVLLIAPHRVISTVTNESGGRAATIVGRLLGLRHLLQALTVERSGSRGWLLVGIVADIAHALTMVAVVVLSPDHRRLAAFTAAVASGWALTGVRAVRRLEFPAE